MLSNCRTSGRFSLVSPRRAKCFPYSCRWLFEREFTSHRRLIVMMKKLMMFVFAFGVLMSMGLVAQDNSSASQDSMKASPSTTKATKVTGKISDDGKTFVNDQDGKSWTISNPDAVKGHEGHHVTLRAQVDATNNAVQVVSLKMAGDSTKGSPQN